MRPTTSLLRLSSSHTTYREAFSARTCNATRTICAHAPGPRLQLSNSNRNSRSANPPRTHPQQPRLFSTTAATLKKNNKASRSSSTTTTPPPTSSSPSSSVDAAAATTTTEDPFDFSSLEADLGKIVERLKTDVSKLRSGGRFNPEVLEGLRVTLGKNEGGAVVKLGDVAQVIPKGRVVDVLVGEIEHLKPLTTAILSSTLSLTPQPDPTGTNPLLLHIAIPPPTAESRSLALAAATKAGETANLAVRNARQACQKKLRAMQLAKTVRPDDLKKAGALMEKVVEGRGTGEVKKVVEGVRRVLDS